MSSGLSAQRVANTCGLMLTPVTNVGPKSATKNEYTNVPCHHPMESVTVHDVLGSNASTEFVDAYTGFNSYCLCLACSAQFELDIDHEGRNCPECDANKVYTEQEMVGKSCPACSIGVVIEQFTGGIT
jgi:DNA-directed RNA polymerase subunit RPC12/RpoP